MEAEDAAIRALKDAEEIDVPPIPRLVADDTTPEAAATLLAEQNGRIAVISTEGGVFDIIAGRYSGKSVNMDVFLKGHSGDVIRIDRKGRSSEFIPRPALTVGLMVQPAVLHTIAANKDFRGRGLLARFLYALPVSKVGHRQVDAATVSDHVTTAYDGNLAELAKGLANWAGDPAILTLTPKATQAMNHIAAAVEPQLRDDGTLGALRDWGSKYVGAIARIAGLIHLAERGPEKGPTSSVDAETVRRAYLIGEYYKACAINVFIEMGTDDATTDAVFLLDRIDQLGVTELSERDIHRAGRSRFTTKAALQAPLARLVENGYLAELESPEPEKRGRRPSVRYRVVPR